MTELPSSGVVGFYGQGAVGFFTTGSGCDQLSVDPIHARCGTLNLLMTDILNLVQVALLAPIGNLDHFSLSSVIRWLRLLQTCGLLEYSLWYYIGLALV